MLGIAMVDLLVSVVLLIIMSITKLGTLDIENDSVMIHRLEITENNLVKEDEANQSLNSSGILQVEQSRHYEDKLESRKGKGK